MDNELIESLIVSDTIESSETERVTSSIQIRKPKVSEFFRCKNISNDIVINEFAFMEDKLSFNMIYLVTPVIYKSFERHCFRGEFVFCINRQGGLFFWPLKKNKNGRSNSWNDSSREMAECARDSWVSKEPVNFDDGRFFFRKAVEDLGDPEWPEKSVSELLTMAMKNRIIEDESHPVIKNISGYNI